MAMEDYTCSLPSSTPEAQAALEGVRSIAVVGVSENPSRSSYRIARFLKQLGYRVIAVNPALDEFEGEKAYPSLEAYGQPVDLVNIFRKPEAVPEIVNQAIRLGCKVIWMQENISHDEAAVRAVAAGLKVIQNRCIRKVLLHREA
jgi:predicted CoA-binding protein